MNSDDTFMYVQGVSQGRDECEKEIAILKKRVKELESDIKEAVTAMVSGTEIMKGLSGKIEEL